MMLLVWRSPCSNATGRCNDSASAHICSTRLIQRLRCPNSSAVAPPARSNASFSTITANERGTAAGLRSSSIAANEGASSCKLAACISAYASTIDLSCVRPLSKSSNIASCSVRPASCVNIHPRAASTADTWTTAAGRQRHSSISNGASTSKPGAASFR